MRITSTEWRVVVTYTRPQSHGQTQQTYNSPSMGGAYTRATLEFGRPTVKRVQIIVVLETMEKD